MFFTQEGNRHGVPTFIVFASIDSFSVNFANALANTLGFTFFSAIFGFVIAFANGGGSLDQDPFESSFPDDSQRYNDRYDVIDRDWNEINRTTASGFQDNQNVVSGQSLIKTGVDPY